MAGSRPIISVVGLSKSGKTTFLEGLIAELVRRGIKVGVIKHTHHSFMVDQEGKDSFRLKKAGAKTVVLSSPYRLAAIKELEEEVPLSEIVDRFMKDTDIVITEGYKKERTLKIEVIDEKKAKGPVVAKAEDLICVVSHGPVEADVPVYRVSQVREVADLIVGLMRGAAS